MLKLILLLSILITVDSQGQLKVSDLSQFNIGRDLFSSRRDLNNLFSTSPRLYKSNRFSSVYQYEFANSSFNYSDNAYYNFLYVDDKLVNLNISLRFEYSKEKTEGADYLKALETIISDLKDNNRYIEFLPKESSINLKKIALKTNSIEYYFNRESFNDNYMESLYGEYNYYSFKNSGSDVKILNLSTSIVKYFNNDSTAKNIYFWINLVITSKKYQNYRQKYVSSFISVKEAKTEIDLKYENGVYSLPANINGVLSLNFILDLGASDVSISPDVFSVLYKTGTINDDDFIGTETYKFADGSTAKSSVFNLRTLKIGDIELKNVRASISNNINSPLLLGQSALRKLPSYKIDNANRKLIIE